MSVGRGCLGTSREGVQQGPGKQVQLALLMHVCRLQVPLTPCPVRAHSCAVVICWRRSHEHDCNQLWHRFPQGVGAGGSKVPCGPPDHKLVRALHRSTDALQIRSQQVPYVNTFANAGSGGSMGGWAGIAVDQTTGKVRPASGA